jgi:hypothetical protein
MRVVEPKQGLYDLWVESLKFPARKNSARLQQCASAVLQTDKSRYYWPESPQISLGMNVRKQTIRGRTWIDWPEVLISFSLNEDARTLKH